MRSGSDFDLSWMLAHILTSFLSLLSSSAISSMRAPSGVRPHLRAALRSSFRSAQSVPMRSVVEDA